jgi:hypothetical protein
VDKILRRYFLKKAFPVQVRFFRFRGYKFFFGVLNYSAPHFIIFFVSMVKMTRIIPKGGRLNSGGSAISRNGYRGLLVLCFNALQMLWILYLFIST